MATKAISDSSFATDVLASDKPVLVDFWAEWCGPCKMIGPALEEISDELGEKVTIAKLNIDDHPDAPAKYGVRGIPTMILFKNGQPAATKVGAAPKSQLMGWIVGELKANNTRADPSHTWGEAAPSRPRRSSPTT